MIRYFLIFLFTSICLAANAQEGNNWVLGLYGGVDFNNNPPKVFKSSLFAYDSKKNPGFAEYPESISDCNGKLLYYIGGDSLIWNKEHKLLPSYSLLRYRCFNNFFVPAPLNDSFVYLFRLKIAGNKNSGLQYSIINNYLDSGRGDFEMGDQKVMDSAGYCAGFIKHKNDTDYWILVKTSLYTIHAYLLSKKGISNTPIISNFTASNGYNGMYEYHIRASNNGKFIVSTFDEDTNQYFSYKLYNFDRGTGMLSYNQDIIPFSAKHKSNAQFSFSPNDSILYCMTGKYPKLDSTVIYQLPVYDTIKFTQAVPIYANDGLVVKYNSPGSQLGPDNRLYLGFSADSSRRSFSYIKYPDVWGKECEFVLDGLTLLSGSSNYSHIFPCHSYPIKRINNRFQVKGSNACGSDSTIQFTADSDSAFSAFRWYFGDGDSTDGKSVSHTYKAAGSYYVRLACTLGPCGYKQWVGDSVTLKLKPILTFNTQKNIACGYQTADVSIAYKYTDTLHITWGDGKDTLIMGGNNNILANIKLQHIYNKSGNFNVGCKVWNIFCYDSAATTYNITIDTIPKASFNADYVTNCGAKDIVLTDTSKFDSVIVNRTWHIYKVGGLDTTINTGTINNLSFLFNDTGVYSAKLIMQSKQGCIDSLEKINYIQINPLPVSKISGKTSWCGTDSTTLTVTGGMGYIWSTGDTTASVFLKPVTSNYYSVTVTNNYNCSVKDSVYISVGKIVTPYFTPNYAKSCGNSTITLTDSSGMDSLIQQRKWTIYYPNNIIKQYDTVTTNKLKLIVQDTGYYNAKLIYITKQGCMDSLTKTNVFRILPQPVVYIDSPSHNPLCFGDSFILTAKQKDINYPPLVTYKWNAGQVATPSIKVDTANSYYVAAVNTFGCGAQSNTVKISFLPQLFVNIKTASNRLYTVTTRPVVSYTWYKDNVLYDSTSSIYYPPTGRYTVHVVDGNGCVANSGSLFHTGVNQIEQNANLIHVYPNPVHDVLYVEWPSQPRMTLVGNGERGRTMTNQLTRDITMYDMMGRSVLQLVGDNTNQKQFPIGQLPKGLYILSVGGEKVKVLVE